MKYILTLILLFLLGVCCMCESKFDMPERNKKEILVVGHRGNAKFAPENTMESYSQAVNMGADIIETDVRITKDGVLIFMHDDSVDRTSNGTGKIEEKTFAELRGYDFGYADVFGDKYHGEPILSVEEGMKYFKKKNAKVFYEIKTPAVIKPLAELINKIKPSKKNTMFLVWNLNDSKALSTLLKGYRIAHLSPIEAYVTAENKTEYFDTMKANGITDLDPNFSTFFDYLNQQDRDLFAILAAKYKMKLGLWTLDSTGNINKAAEYQVKGQIKNKTYIGKIDMITTNDPEKTILLLGKKLKNK